MKSPTTIDAEPFHGVKRAYTLLFLYIMEIIEKLGTNLALEMLQRAVEKQTEIVARELGKGMPQDLNPIEAGLATYRRFMEDAGAEVQIHRRNDTSTTVMVRRCPFHEALLDIGVDCGYFLGGLCSDITIPSIQAALIRFDPMLRLEAEIIRQSAEEFCLERIYLQQA